MMADAPKINPTDTLRESYPKLNQAIDNANEALNKASIAETNSTNAVNTANSVQSQLNQIVIEGDSSVEAAQARVDADGNTYTTLKERLDTKEQSFSAQLAHIENMENFEISSKKRGIEPLIVFALDDGSIHDYETILPVLSKYGFVASTGIITNQPDNPNFPYTMSWQQIKELQDVHGWEIASHATDNVDLTTLSEAEIDEQLRESKKTLLEKGLDCRNFFLPQGKYNSTVKRLSKKYYRSVRVSGQANIYRINKSPFDMYQVNCLFFGDTTGIGTPTDSLSGFPIDTVDYFKWHIDWALEENLVFVIGMHSSNLHQNNRKNDLDLLCQYIHSLGVPVVTYNEMLNRVGNIVDTPDFKVGATGIIGGKYGKVKLDTHDSVLNDTPITEIDEGFVTINTVTNGRGGGLPDETGGTITSVKVDGISERAYQLIKSYGKNKGLYFRDFDAEGNPTKWRRLDNIYTHSKLPSTHKLTDLMFGMINVCSVLSADASGYPEGQAGFLYSPRLSNYTSTNYEDYHVYNTDRIYRRFWDASKDDWTPWRLLLQTTTLSYNSVTLDDDINIYPSGVSYLTITQSHSQTHGFPEGLAGTLETHKVFTGGYIWQYFHIVNSTRTYKRVYKSDGSWSNFVKVND